MLLGCLLLSSFGLWVKIAGKGFAGRLRKGQAESCNSNVATCLGSPWLMEQICTATSRQQFSSCSQILWVLQQLLVVPYLTIAGWLCICAWRLLVAFFLFRPVSFLLSAKELCWFC